MSTDKTEWEFEKRVEGKNIHSVYTLCNECHTWGINLPFNHQCGNCNTTDTTLYFDIETINQEISQALQQERERVADILDRHASWKPTCGYGSEEEKGYQKGLIAEAKLIKSEIESLSQPKEE